jgi:hypothetical protein
VLFKQIISSTKKPPDFQAAFLLVDIFSTAYKIRSVPEVFNLIVVNSIH